MVRYGEMIDVPAVLELAREFSKDIGTERYWSDKQGASLIARMIVDGMLLVSEEKDKITGVIGGLIGRSLWNPHYRTLDEQIFYVTPKYRNTRAGYLLIKEYENEASMLDVVCSTLKLMHNSPDITKFYHKLGYEKLETTYIKWRK